MDKIKLTITKLREEAKLFSEAESKHHEPSLYGVTDGKAVGTYLEHKFQEHLRQKYKYDPGSSARGIDFPGLGVDIKVTSIRQPQSSCPFKTARQKIYGLGYSVLLFVYGKQDDSGTRKANLNILHTIFIKSNRTADYQITRLIRDIVQNNGNKEDVIAAIRDRNLPVDDISVNKIAEEVLKSPPEQGYLTISNALQWRLQYSRIVEVAGTVKGVIRIR